MKMSGGPASVNLKLVLILIALAIAFGTLYYTNKLVSKLQEKERQIVELYAKGIEYIANTENPDADITFLFDNIIKPIDFPLILTDKDDHINLDSKTDLRNIKLDSTLSREQQEKILYKMMNEMDEVHP
ncbi:MAG: sensor histidine kinase, partial [Ignavibacterium sp.]|nr:sensor histidine kinase [Ignavibacterium sp.]